jgi:heme/copper-type cytochrome/quinol oxidase subunit 3
VSEHATTFETEPPDLLDRNITVAGQLLASASAFFFLAFLFAYVYLRSLNSDGRWHPKGVHPPVGLGAFIAALLVLCAVALRLALVDERGRRYGGRNGKLTFALAFGVAALVVQLAEWATIGFGPADGGYASVFVGWTAFYFLFLVLALYWLETQLATALRHRKGPLTGLEGLAFFWTFFAALGILTWVVLYLISP